VAPPQSRLVLIGLDACDRRFIAAHAAALPNISAILAAGRTGELAAEPMSGGIWATFVTGARPEVHGVMHQLQWDPAQMRMRCPGRDWLPIRPFWRDLAERGVRVVAFDIPFVFPGDAPNLVEVMNWGAHDLVGPFWTNDPKLSRKIRARHGAHPMGVDIPVPKTGAQLDRHLRQVLDGAALKAALAVELMREQPWDVFITAFGEIHRGGHSWAPDGPWDQDGASDLLRIYQAVDRGVGAMVEAAGPGADVVLFSLHGMGPNSSQGHLTSKFMQRAAAHFQGRPPPPEAADAPGLMRKLRHVLPPGLQLMIAKAVPQWARDAVVSRAIAGGYRWDDTLGFCLHGDPSSYLRLNLRGREAKGLLDADEAAAFKTFLRDELLATTLPDGRKAVAKVTFPSAEAKGPRAHLLPDVLVEWNPQARPAEALHTPHLGVIRGKPQTGRGGNHSFDAFYAHRGPRQDTALRPGHISELAALVADLV
jgi:predicted AlkP superfamily phosphohydrolase/phosphomutase